jgi:ubiquinone/menaquinone biosynthesis C-methylase UbiE
MDVSTYAVESSVEAAHWWFMGRRKLFAKLIKELGISKDARVLDVGTSTGTNLRLLKELGFGRVDGLDPSDEAIRWCADKGLGKVTKGDVCNVPFPDQTFDLILATDVIEHVDDDVRALSEVRRVLKMGAPVIVTVPAFQALWGLQDEVSQHKRRYRANEIRARFGQVGIHYQSGFYFNYILFLPILVARILFRLSGAKLKSENEFNSPLLNSILKMVFSVDIASAPTVRPPFGVSYLAIGVRQSDTELKTAR